MMHLIVGKGANIIEYSNLGSLRKEKRECICTDLQVRFSFERLISRTQQKTTQMNQQKQFAHKTPRSRTPGIVYHIITILFSRFVQL